MDAHIIGETIFEGADSSTTPPSSIYTPWAPRGGDSGVFSIEVVAINGLTLTWRIETKNHEDVDSAATTSGSAVTTSAAGVASTSTLSGLKEQVRYRFDTGGTASMDWVHLRVLPVSWQSN